MRTIIKTLAVILAWAVPVLAANSSETHGNGLLLQLFMGFGAVIVVFKLSPGIMQFAAMTKELFTPKTKRVPATMPGVTKDS